MLGCWDRRDWERARLIAWGWYLQAHNAYVSEDDLGCLAWVKDWFVTYWPDMLALIDGELEMPDDAYIFEAVYTEGVHRW